MTLKIDTANLRVGNIASVVPVLCDLGVNVDAALDHVGLHASIFDNPEMLIPYSAYDELLALGITESGCNHLGLLVGASSPNLGLPGFLMMNAPTARAGLLDIISCLTRIDSGGVAELSENSGVATLAYSVVVLNLRCADHLCDTAIAIAYGALFRLIGSEFAPIEIRLPRRRPLDPGPFRSFFSRGYLRFDAHEAAIDFPASHLDAPNVKADPALYQFFKHLISQEIPADTSIAEHLKHVLPNLVRHQKVNSQVISRLYRIPPRTLARRLAEENVTLHSLIEDARFEVAQQLLKDTDLQLTEIAANLYYSDASAFTRAFRRKLQMTPSGWRNGHHQVPTF